MLVRNLARATSGSMAVAQGFVVRILMLAMNLGTGILSARILGPTGRAEQAALLVGIGIFPAFLSLGMPIAVQYRLKKDPEAADRIVSTATCLSILFGIVSVIVSFFVLPHMLTQYSISIIRILRSQCLPMGSFASGACCALNPCRRSSAYAIYVSVDLSHYGNSRGVLVVGSRQAEALFLYVKI
jgi:Na+-driven multidrug efflux pump